MTTLHVALEIGTTRTVLALGESENGGRPKITLAAIPSAGVRKSQILDIAQATQSIRGVLQEIENKQAKAGNSISLGNAFLVVSGQHIKADRFTGSTPIQGAHVSDDDLREVAVAVRAMPIAKDRELLDIVDQDYAIDALSGIHAPKGMSGRMLSLNTLHITADRNRVENARTAANGAHLEIREPLFAATCAADAVLEDHEKKNGVIVLDLGGGSTGYAAYCDGYLVATGVIGIGGDHVTNDIAHAFQTTQSQAEELKRTSASAVMRSGAEDAGRVKIPGTSPLLETRTISLRALNTVANARLRELFAMIRERLEELDLMQRLHAGVVLTGGACAMSDLDALAQRELGMDTRIGRPIHVDGTEGEDLPPSAAAISGALLYALRNYEDKPFLSSIFGGIFK